MSNAAPLHMPRWEWRTFAPTLADLRRHRLAGAAVQREEDRETRFLCPRSMHDVAVSRGILRLKWRKQVGPDGLELWDAILSHPFPCPAAVIRDLFSLWGLPVPVLARPEYSKSQFLGEVVPQCVEVRVVQIDRQAETFILDGVSCELVRLRSDALQLETFCAEHEDPGLTLQVIHRLGFRAQDNTSYPLGLKAALHIPQQH